MEAIDAADAERRFDEIIAKVELGATILIHRDGKPIARFRPPLSTDQAEIGAIAILEPPLVELKA